MFEMHDTNNMPVFLPEDPPRKGTFIRTGTNQRVGGWFNLHHLPASST